MRRSIRGSLYWIVLIKAAFLCITLSLCRSSAPLTFLHVILHPRGSGIQQGCLTKPVTAISGDTGFQDQYVKENHDSDKLLELRKQLKENYGKEHPLRESFIKGTGPGGQNVNKSSNCVQLVQYSTAIGNNIVVKCHMHRSLLQNRIEATRILLKKLKEAEEEPLQVAKQLEEKEKRKILKLSAAEKTRKKFEKQLRSQKKANRLNSKVVEHDF